MVILCLSGRSAVIRAAKFFIAAKLDALICCAKLR